MLIYAERLTELRTEKGINQKTAAAELGVSQALLSHYEKGIREFGLEFLCRAAEYYNVTADYLLGRSNSRNGLDSSSLEDRPEDSKFNSATVYRAAIMTHERMNAGSSQAGERTDILYAVAIYRTLYTASQMGYIPKRWFSLPQKIGQFTPIALTESILTDFPEKNITAKRYGGPEPTSIETVIKSVENILRRAALSVRPTE